MSVNGGYIEVVTAYVHCSSLSLSLCIGDFASFLEHVRDVAAEQGRDLIVVDNGDQIDGTGLSDATLPNGVDLFPLLKYSHMYTAAASLSLSPSLPPPPPLYL
jgi:2',3'-cyclic-nucleotide 2'-phosphodiesterase (5'-nucleotidase family)